MGSRRIAAIALSGALVAGGAGAAIAAVTRQDDRKAEQAILDDAAKRLGVTAEKLREALAAAQDAQLDRAVKDGLLTRRRADAIKQARERSGRVLAPPFARPPLHGGAGRFGHGPHALGLRHGLLGDVAKALDTTPAQLFEQLRSGKSLADVAKANGTSLSEVRSAVKAATKRRVEDAVKRGDLTQRQADAILERVDAVLDRIESGRALLPRRHRRGVHPGPPPIGPLRPGGLMPGEDLPELVPPGGTYS